jgi:hypothetical protein
MNEIHSISQPRASMSFLIPVKNISTHFESLRTQIESNYVDGDEVIVVDDYSVDNTYPLLQTWSKSAPYLNVIRNVGESGIAQSLNIGLRTATKNWIARFDADDLYSTERTLMQARHITEGCVAVFSDYEFISKNGFSLGKVASAVYPIQTSLSLIMGNRTAHPSVIFNRLAALEAGAYRSQDYLAEDLSLWLRMSRLGDLRSVPEVLLRYRLNPGSATINSRAQSRLMKQSILSEIGINRTDIERALTSLETLQNMYVSNEFSALRQWLFLRDVQESLQFVRSNSNSQIQRLLKKNLVASSLQSMPSLSQAVSEQIFRDLYRKSIFISKN